VARTTSTCSADPETWVTGAGAVHFGELPKTSAGKIQKFLLRERQSRSSTAP